MQTVEDMAPNVPTAPLCDALSVPRATLYRRRKQARAPTSEPTPRPTPERALAPAERQRVLDVLHSKRFVDTAPAEVVATLMDEKKYLCSERTMYRILASEDEVRERRNQLRHPHYAKPELLATGPNQVWSWDITKLKGPTKWTYFYLYVMIDIFSRYVVGWMVAQRENAELAKRLIRESCDKEGIEPEQLTIHSDRGSPMKAKTTGQLLADLGVTKSHSRPHVSNDNPFSESQFKTFKYRPGFPERFGGQQHALSWSRVFFPWYNQVHRHSGIAMLTPEMVHRGQADAVLAQRHEVALAAYHAHPERFVNGPPKPVAAPHAVWINPPEQSGDTTEGELH
jgi:putative transposase